MTECVYICSPGWETPLLDELARVYPTGVHEQRSPGWLYSQLSEADAERCVSLTFVLQSLPSPMALEASSIVGWVKAVGPKLVEALATLEGPWELQVFCVDYPGSPVTQLRCNRIREGLIEWLSQKQRRLSRTLCPELRLGKAHEELTPGTQAEGAALVMLGLETPQQGWLSVLLPTERTRQRGMLSRLPGGRLPVPDDLGPPSSAFKKVVEAELQLGQQIQPGQRCVDLGGCPGGWSYIALQRGARVVAVDRSPLREDLMKHKRLFFVEGDAFKFEPPRRADWLLCDVIAFPQRSIELLETWLSRGWCERFVITLKFKGQDEYERLEQCKAMLAKYPVTYVLRRLQANRNEATVMGFMNRVEGSGEPSDEQEQG
ncbi:MAG: SAM-dependent methyltransferase [Myxococcota bacterium]